MITIALVCFVILAVACALSIDWQKG
jgi:hypothetical protein